MELTEIFNHNPRELVNKVSYKSLSKHALDKHLYKRVGEYTPGESYFFDNYSKEDLEGFISDSVVKGFYEAQINFKNCRVSLEVLIYFEKEVGRSFLFGNINLGRNTSFVKAFYALKATDQYSFGDNVTCFPCLILS